MRSGPWALANFAGCIDGWIARDEPGDDLRLLVAAWIFTRVEDPYLGVRRERPEEFENLWYGTVPMSHHDNDVAVMCAYWIYDRERLIRCESIATLGLPH